MADIDVESLIQIEDGISLEQLKQVNDAFEVLIYCNQAVTHINYSARGSPRTRYWRL